MRNNLLKWHCCLTHKTLKCIYDDLTGRLGGSTWVCIWERGRIRPLTQSNKCYCIYSLADSLMFFSQRLAASIFFLVDAEEWGGRCSPPWTVQGETIKPKVRTGRRLQKKELGGRERNSPCPRVLLCFKITLRRAGTSRWTNQQMVRLLLRDTTLAETRHLHTATNDIWIVYCQTVQTVLICKEL